MKTRVLLPFVILFAMCGSSIGQPVPGWGEHPVWSDEFTGANGSEVNRANWTYDKGGGGWGNNELQYYTDRRENSRIENGMLIIEARKEQLRNRNYTSARLKTQGLQTWTYGRVEARIRFPIGQGVWPAFWMLGANFPEVGWPNCGEIDAMEYVLSLGNKIRGSAHGPGYSGADSLHGDREVANLAADFHEYVIEWEPTEIRWFVDGTQYHSVHAPGSASGPIADPWVFNHPFFIILNVAVGGDWPGPPDGSVNFPVRMEVDYVRVYQKTLPPPPNLTPLFATITMAKASKGPTWEAVATVRVTGDTGNPVSGVTVRGTWSGLITVGVTERVTDSNGIAVLNSGKVRQAGAIKFTVSDLIKTGCYYASAPDEATISGP